MKKFLIIFSICVSLLILSFSFFMIKTHYDTYCFNRNLISETIKIPLRFQNDTTIVDILQLKGKYIVLYFWDSTSKDYLKKNSDYQKMYNSRLRNDERVKMYAVYCYPQDKFNLAETDDFNFPNFPLCKNDGILEQLKIDSFPTALIISPEWKIIFRGSLDSAFDCMLRLTYTISDSEKIK